MLQAYNEQVNFQEGENVQHITCETTEFGLHEMEKETVSKYTGIFILQPVILRT